MQDDNFHNMKNDNSHNMKDDNFHNMKDDLGYSNTSRFRLTQGQQVCVDPETAILAGPG